MIKNNIAFLFLTLIILLSLSCCSDGCMEEDKQLFVGIGDRNYTNIMETDPSSLVGSNRDIRFFIPSLSYNIKDSKNKIIEKTITTDSVLEIKVPEVLSNNSYSLTVWGNTLHVNPLERQWLHSNHTEGYDLYLQQRTVDFSKTDTAHVYLRRTKGKLITLLSNFPSNITSVRQEISNVYEQVDRNFIYYGSTSVAKNYPLSNKVGTYIAPTVSGQLSSLTYQFYENNNTTPVITITGIDQLFLRNTINLVKINYNENDLDLDVWISVDGNWAKISPLILRI